MKNYRIIAQVLLLISIMFSGQAMAQSTIFNIPTTDTVAKKHVYGEFDFMPQVPAYDDDSRLYLYNPRVVVGAPGNVEFGVNFPTYNYRSSMDSETFAYIQPNAKWRFYNNDNYGIALAVGGILNAPLNRREGQDTWGLLYGLFSKKIKTGNYGRRACVQTTGVMAPCPRTMIRPGSSAGTSARFLDTNSRFKKGSALWRTGSAERMASDISRPGFRSLYRKTDC